jgi:hypothetical protein
VHCLTLQVSNGTGLPDVVAVNNQPCTIQTAALPPPAPPQASHTESASSLTTRDGEIIGVDGNPLMLWGINWFGFEDGTTMVDGLWAGMICIPVWQGKNAAGAGASCLCDASSHARG